ncbi:unnamed protein product [Dicrocoelium dendriticum]|nr:unnamed protein product [Dicrocoelium dendriticum]
MLLLWDPNTNTILGHPWRKCNIPVHGNGKNAYRAIVDETLYLCTSRQDAQILFSLVQKNHSSSKEIGWVKCTVADCSDKATNYPQAYSINPGSVRAVFVEKNTSALPTYTALQLPRIHVQIGADSNLKNVKEFFPANVFISSAEQCVGIEFNQGMLRGVCQPCTKVYFDRLRLKIPLVELTSFENDFIDRVHADLWAQRKGEFQEPNNFIEIAERRLKVFFHNRFKVLEPVPVVYLDLYTGVSSEDIQHWQRVSMQWARNESSVRAGPRGEVQSAEMALIARNPVELSVPVSPGGAVIFVLEYLIAKRRDVGPDKLASVLPPENSRFTVRWGAYCIHDTLKTLEWDEETVELSVDLQGTKDDGFQSQMWNLYSESDDSSNMQLHDTSMGHSICPDGTLCYREGGKSETIFELTGRMTVGRIPHSDLIQERKEQAQVSTEMRAITESQKRPLRKKRTSTPMKLDVNLKRSAKGMSKESHTSVSQLAACTQLLQQVLNAQSLNIPHTTALTGDLAMQVQVKDSLSPVYEAIQPASNSLLALSSQNARIILPAATQGQGGLGSSQVAHAILHATAFPQVKTESGETPYTVNLQNDPDPVNVFDYEKEASDVLCANEVVIQFLAFSTFRSSAFHSDTIRTDEPKEIYFTSQFYRFPPITTARLKLGKEFNNCPYETEMCCRILERNDQTSSGTVPAEEAVNGQQASSLLDPVL